MPFLSHVLDHLFIVLQIFLFYEEEDLFGILSIRSTMSSLPYMLLASGIYSTEAFVEYCGKLPFSLTLLNKQQ